MATADGIMAKIQGLIDQANSVTGMKNTTLHGAVSSLIGGYQGGSFTASADGDSIVITTTANVSAAGDDIMIGG